MDFLIDNIASLWQYLIVVAIILIGLIVNIIDNKLRHKVRVGFEYESMPVMRPIAIPTKSKGFWGAVWLWLIGVRQWELADDFHFKLGGTDFVIPAGFRFDGASVPKFLAVWLSPVGVLLMGGLIHDYAYKYETLLKADRTTIDKLTQKKADEIFRDINIENNGFVVLNYLAYWALRIAGFVAWNGHRKRNCQVGEQ